MKSNSIFLLLLCFLLTCSCDDEKSKNNCDNVSCTKEFKAITVKFKDALGNPIVLDYLQVIREEEEKDITIRSGIDWDLQQKLGAYLLVDDSMLKDLQYKEVKVKLHGFVDNLQIVEADYTVGADCCHVMLVEGKTDMFLNLWGKWKLIATQISPGGIVDWTEVKNGEEIFFDNDKVSFSKENISYTYAFANFKLNIENKGNYFISFIGTDTLILSKEGCIEGCFYKYKRLEK